MDMSVHIRHTLQTKTVFCKCIRKYVAEFEILYKCKMCLTHYQTSVLVEIGLHVV